MASRAGSTARGRNGFARFVHERLVIRPETAESDAAQKCGVRER